VFEGSGARSGILPPNGGHNSLGLVPEGALAGEHHRDASLFSSGD
jgi:hypothetical protein